MSGLRDPARSVRSVGVAALAAEALVLLLAIQPIRVLGGTLTGAAIGFVAAISVLCAVLAGMLRRAWAWAAGFVPQVALVVGGFAFHASLAVLGVLFGLVWWYVLHVRRTVLRTPTRPDPPAPATG